MSTDETYNGWSNYPTWCVNLWLSNDRDVYDATREIARNEAQEARIDDRVIDGTWTVEQAARFRTADELKQWVREDLAPDLGASFAADLLGFAFDLVDWNEIADAWLSELGEAV